MVNADIRAVYARAVATAAHVRNGAVEAAFAAVPREQFLGPPPWTVLGNFGMSRTTSDARELYRDVLVTIDRQRGINNGEPQLWALVFDRLAIEPSMRILHVGAGTGYYSAILAEFVGPNGRVDAFEVEADLAERARAALVSWPQTIVSTQDAAELAYVSFDRIVFSCGVTSLPGRWLDGIGEGARIAVPLTGADHAGVFLMLTRKGSQFEALPLCGVSIFPAAGFRSSEQERVLDGVRRADREAIWNIRSLRRTEETVPAERIYGFGHYMFSSRSVDH